MEVMVNIARRAEDAYVLSTKPELARFRGDGTAKQRFPFELGQVCAALEAAGTAAFYGDWWPRSWSFEIRMPAAASPQPSGTIASVF